MAFDDLRAAINLLLEQLEDQPEDLHELHMQLIEKLNEFKAEGLPLPEDLVELEAKLTRDVEGVTD